MGEEEEMVLELAQQWSGDQKVVIASSCNRFSVRRAKAAERD